MSPERTFSNIHIDHVKPISSFDVSKEEELLEAFNWRNTQPLSKEDNLKKVINLTHKTMLTNSEKLENST